MGFFGTEKWLPYICSLKNDIIKERKSQRFCEEIKNAYYVTVCSNNERLTYDDKLF